MKKYVVTFGTRDDLKVEAASNRFDTLRQAREFAKDYWNANITVVDNNGIIGYCKTRQDIKRGK